MKTGVRFKIFSARLNQKSVKILAAKAWTSTNHLKTVGREKYNTNVPIKSF